MERGGEGFRKTDHNDVWEWTDNPPSFVVRGFLVCLSFWGEVWCAFLCFLWFWFVFCFCCLNCAEISA